MKDYADFAQDIYQEGFSDDYCPQCGGSGRIPDEECETDCECNLCEGTGLVPTNVRRNYLKEEKKDLDYNSYN